MGKSVLLVGTLDTKGLEFQFVRGQLGERGMSVIVVDVGVGSAPAFQPDVTRDQVAREAGERRSLRELEQAERIAVMADGVARVAGRLYREGTIGAVMGMGGSAGSLLASAAMREVPLGVPKLIVSTAASGDVSHYVGSKDICVVNPVTDISGLNSISRSIFTNAAAAMSGMAAGGSSAEAARQGTLIGATMMGVTTPCIEQARRNLEAAGREVAVFHAIGSGGAAMESIIRDGGMAAVLDVTTVEIPNHLLGGVCDAGPDRLEVAGRAGIPQVVSCGGLDFINFYGGVVPERYRGRLLHEHNEVVTLMRTSPEENAKVARTIAAKLNRARGPVAFFVPLLGFSAVDAAGEVFHDPQADRAFVETLERHLSTKVELVKCENHINDAEFATRLTDYLQTLL